MTNYKYQEVYGYLKNFIQEDGLSHREAVRLLSKTLGVTKQKVYGWHHYAVKRGMPSLWGSSKYQISADAVLSAKAPKPAATKAKTVSVMTVAVIETLAKYPDMLNALDKKVVSDAFEEMRRML